MTETFTKPCIGFIGLGVMGGPMALNLVTAGYPLVVLDLVPDKVAELTTAGARAGTSVAELAREADVVMTSLPGPAQVRELGCGPDGLIRNMRAGSSWIDLSTNNLEVCRELESLAAEHDIGLLDAPVSGGDEGSRAGTLTVVVGGDAELYERMLPVLQVIGEHIEHLGPNGAGYTAKIAQVMLCYVHTLALGEAMMLGVRGGVNVDKMLAIISNSAAYSYSSERYGPCLLDGDYDPSFTLGLSLKDLRLALELAKSVDTDLPVCELVTNNYATACERYGNDANHLMAVRLLEESHNTWLRSESQGNNNS